MANFKIGGIDAEVLASKYQTPLYVYDQNKMEQVIDSYQKHFVSKKFETEVVYASKAFSCYEMIKLLQTKKMSLDVVSGGELFLAREASFDPNRIFFHGNNKTKRELQEALEYGVKNIVVDNFMELQLLNSLLAETGKKAAVLLRLNVGVEAHTHRFIVTAHIDSKFGLNMEGEELFQCLDLIETSPYLSLEGFHSHIGSQIFEINAFFAAIDKLIHFIKKFNNSLTLNIGGGFGVRYTQDDEPMKINELCHKLISHTEELILKENVVLKKLVIEPGRSIVAEAGYTLYEIGNIKKTPNKEYYFVDGGMTDNIRPALYGANYQCDIVSKMTDEKTNVVTIAGKCCESGDIIIEDIALPKANRGDILVVYTTGAYGHSMSSNYNKALTPAVVFVKDGQSKVVVRRQTYQDLINLDVTNR